MTSEEIANLPEVKKLKLNLRYYETTLSYAHFNFSYEKEYIAFVKERHKLIREELLASYGIKASEFITPKQQCQHGPQPKNNLKNL